MTTDRTPSANRTSAATGTPTAKRRRPRQAPTARALATGAAFTATGVLVTIMAVGAAPDQVVLQAPPAASVVAAAPLTPPTTIVIVHRPAASTAVAAAPSAGRAAAAPRSAPRAPAPAPVATSSAS